MAVSQGYVSIPQERWQISPASPSAISTVTGKPLHIPNLAPPLNVRREITQIVIPLLVITRGEKPKVAEASQFFIALNDGIRDLWAYEISGLPAATSPDFLLLTAQSDFVNPISVRQSADLRLTIRGVMPASEFIVEVVELMHGFQVEFGEGRPGGPIGSISYQDNY